MTNQSTIDKLIEMRLTAMADAFRIQMDDPAMKEVPFEDRFGMLVDVEYSNRKNNRLKRLHLTVLSYLRKKRDVIFIRQVFNIAESLRRHYHFFVHS